MTTAIFVCFYMKIDDITLKKALVGLDYKLLHGNIDTVENKLIKDIYYDTRTAEKDGIFVCVKGERFDSHDNINELIEKGLALIVIDDKHEDIIKNIKDNINDAAIISVDNTRKALAILSKNFFGDPNNMCLLGVTGTKGKTTTANIIKQSLDYNNKPCGLIGTTGIYFGDTYYKTNNTTPESYLIYKYLREMRDKNIQYACMEVSSQSFIHYRVEGLHFKEAIFTNIYEDHIGPGEHKDFEEYFSCKKELLSLADHAILNKNMTRVEEVIKICTDRNIKYDLVDIEKVKLSNIETDRYFGLRFKIEGDDIDYSLSIPGKHNVENALFAKYALNNIGLSNDNIRDSFDKIKIPGRTEVIYKSDTYTVLVDFAHNELGTKNLLSTMKEYNKKRMVVVFGCGGNRDKERRYGMGRICGKFADFSIVTEDNSRFEETKDIINDILSTLSKETNEYKTFEYRGDAIEYAIKERKDGDLLMVIGKGHEDYIDKGGKKTHFLDKEEIEKILKKEHLI